MPGFYRHTESVSDGGLRPRNSRATTAVPKRRPTRRARYLFDDWTRVAASLRESRQVILFLDFDGTLALLADDPQKARLDDATRATLRRLAQRLPVFIISGRRAADVQKRVAVPGIEYLGLFGFERANRALPQEPGPKELGPHEPVPKKRTGEQRDKPARSKAAEDVQLIGRVRRLVTERLGTLPSIRVEDKGPIFAVHYRGAARDAVRRAEAGLREILEPFRAQLRLAPGKCSWEVMPNDFSDKGAAVQKMLSRFPQGTIAVYAGDDASDEAAFAVLDPGVTVVVGRTSCTKARYYLYNPADVARLLKRLEAALR